MLTIQEAAQEAGISETAIRSAILRGRLLHVEKYGRKLIERTEYERYRESAKPGRPRGTKNKPKRAEGDTPILQGVE